MEVALESVQFTRDGRRVLDIPALHLRNGVTTAVLGPNGSGKTTLLRLIAGLESPHTGRILLGGAPSRRGQPLAYVFQEQVFLRRSVRENMELALRLRAVPSGERRRRVDDALHVLGVSHLAHRRADRLSGGEGRRVSLARALCLRAPLVLLDEPLQGLDQRTYRHLLDELPHLLAAFDATTILVTHNRDEAVRLASDLVLIVDGQVHAAGDKRSVVNDPRSAAVAEVLGYVVLHRDGGAVAVPPGSLRLGQGEISFSLHVEDVVDLLDCREVVGRIGQAHVRIALQGDTPVPCRGSHICVHAERAYALGS